MMRVIVKVTSKEACYCLDEMKGLKEGDIVTGEYDINKRCLNFSWNGQDAVLYIGKNAEFVDSVAVCYVDTYDIIEVFSSVKEAKQFVIDKSINNVELLILKAGMMDDSGNLNWNNAFRFPIILWKKKNTKA